MNTPSGWEIASALAQITSAAGTLAAVVVALYLARRQGSARLTVSVTLVRVVTPGVPGSDEGRFLRIYVANGGFGDVTIAGIGWRVGRLRRSHFFQLQSPYPHSAKVPIKLAPSEAATFLYPWGDWSSKAIELRRSLGSGRLRLRRARTLRFGLSLTTGEMRHYAVDQAVTREVLTLPPIEASSKGQP